MGWRQSRVGVGVGGCVLERKRDGEGAGRGGEGGCREQTQGDVTWYMVEEGCSGKRTEVEREARGEEGGSDDVSWKEEGWRRRGGMCPQTGCLASGRW